jgi:hypothetical protein
MSKISDFISGLLLKVFPFLGFQGTVNTQLAVYEYYKKENQKALDRLASGYFSTPPITFNLHRKEGMVCLVAPYSDQSILNIVLDARRNISPNTKSTNEYYFSLISIPNKTLEQVICAIAEWEYIDSPESIEIRHKKNIPNDFVEKYRNQIKNYIKERIKSL